MADIGHELTEERIKEIEKELQEEYTKAAMEIRAKLDDYFQRFQYKDEVWRQWVYDGERTEEEYIAWRNSQMAAGKRWEKMKDTLADDLMHANDIARNITSGHMPEIFSINGNYSIYKAERDASIDTGLTLYNRDAVNRIVRDRPDLFLPPGKTLSKKIEEGTVKRWERQQIQSKMIQSIMQGKSIPNMARDIAEKTTGSEFKAAVRNARTMSTNAQNAGRYDAYNRLTKAGANTISRTPTPRPRITEARNSCCIISSRPRRSSSLNRMPVIVSDTLPIPVEMQLAELPMEFSTAERPVRISTMTMKFCICEELPVNGIFIP